MTGSLHSYLLQHKSLPLPGLGTILIERDPAYKDIARRELYPPVYHYRFDKYFDAPGKDFFSFLARQEKITDAEAILQFNEWAFRFSGSIGYERAVPFGDIGEFVKDSSGEVVFKPSGQINVFYSPVPAQRVGAPMSSPAGMTVVEPESVVTPAEAPTVSDAYPPFPEEIKKDPWAWYAMALLILMLGLLAWQVYQTWRSGFSFGLRNLPGF